MTRARTAPPEAPPPVDTAPLRLQAQEAGFTVEIAWEGYVEGGEVYPTAYRVVGHGAELIVAEDNEQVWNDLIGHSDAATAPPPEQEQLQQPEG